MKLRNYCILILSVWLVACTDNSSEYIFDKSVNERFEEKKNDYTQILNAPEYGWVGNYSRNGEVGSNVLLLDFDQDGSVVMRSDYRNGANDHTITYRIDKTLKVELVFESHSVLHQIYEINNNDSGGEFVFNITSADENEIVLTSKSDNGYRGEHVTVLHLKKAVEADWDLSPIYLSLKNIIGNPRLSVFRNIEIDGQPICSFTYDEENRAARISYLEDGVLIDKVAPIDLTTNGFSFINPLEIGSVTLKDFTYDADADIFVETQANAKLLFAMTPGVPLSPYPFGQFKSLAVQNLDEAGKSSIAWHEFFQSYNAFMSENYGIEIQMFIFFGLKEGEDKTFQIRTNIGRINIGYDYEVKEDGKVYFTLGESNAPSIIPLLQPFLDIVIESEKGFYIRGTGGYLNYTNGSFSLINGDKPGYEINYWDI